MKASGFLIFSIAILLFASVVIPSKATDLTDATEPLNLLGIVLSSRGTPVTNASIFIYTAGPRKGAGVVCPSCYADCRKSTNSDSSGKFKIKLLSPTLLFQVLIVAPGYAPKFFNRVDPLKGMLEAKLDVRSVTNIPPQQTIAGRVVNTKGELLANAIVSVEDTKIGGTVFGYPPEGTDALAITDDEGQFSIQSPAKFDAMDLRVEARGYARRSFSQVRPALKLVEFVVSEGAALTGQVVSHGQPLINVSIGVAGVDRTLGYFTGDFICGTGENGRFIFMNLPPDRDYALYGLMNSLQPFGAVPVRIVHAGNQGSVIDVGTLQVVPGYRLAGQVKLSDGKPIPDHTHLFIGREAAWDTSVVVELPTDGLFDFTNIPAETISLKTSIKGYRLSERNISLDPMNPFVLIGRLDTHKTNLTVLLEPGEDILPYYAGTPEKLPLAGAENERVIPRR